jgi:hypothetical protein
MGRGRLRNILLGCSRLSVFVACVGLSTALLLELLDAFVGRGPESVSGGLQSVRYYADRHWTDQFIRDQDQIASARVLGVSERSLWDWTRTEGLPYVRNGDVVLYPVICVEQWLADREDTHKTPEPAATIQVAAGSSKLAPVTKTGLVGSTGFEPVTSTV